MAATHPRDEFFIPDLCSGRNVLVVVLLAQLVALLMALAKGGGLQAFLAELGLLALYLLWLGLASAAVLCYARARLARLALPAAAALAWALLVLTATLLGEALYWAVEWSGLGQTLIGRDHGWHVLRHALVSALVNALVLRYFYVQHQWRSKLQSEAEARIQALTARIRPHFLFNSLNTIAALVRQHPPAAEQAIVDLADLFRASLADARALVTLGEEVELTRLYTRLENLRLGERLRVDWQVPEPLPDWRLPRLTLQPLVENAVRHGVELLPQGGTIAVTAGVEGDALLVEVRNPLPPRLETADRAGNRMALDNIRERLALAFGTRARLEVSETAGTHTVRLWLPRRPEQESGT